eukprot:9483030-Pyramimonas_sp.AAC.1
MRRPRRGSHFMLVIYQGDIRFCTVWHLIQETPVVCIKHGDVGCAPCFFATGHIAKEDSGCIKRQ